MSDRFAEAVGEVYGEVLRKHLQAMRDKNDAQREAMMRLADALLETFPAQCRAWEDLWTPSVPPQDVDA